MGRDLQKCSPDGLTDAWVIFNVPFERRWPSDHPDAIRRMTVNSEVCTSGGFDLKVAVVLSFKHPLCKMMLDQFYQGFNTVDIMAITA